MMSLGGYANKDVRAFQELIHARTEDDVGGQHGLEPRQVTARRKRDWLAPSDERESHRMAPNAWCEVGGDFGWGF